MVVRVKTWSNQQKGNPSPNSNNGASLSSIVTRNIIDYVSDLKVISFIINFGTYFNKVESDEVAKKIDKAYTSLW